MDISKNFSFINGLSGDPAVLIAMPQSSDCILFDCGDLSNLSHKELLKVRIVCISHTHMDHFCGFDQIIRVNLPHSRVLDVIGPTGILGNVVSKLKGYTWNLLEPGQINFRVHEVSVQNKICSNFVSNTNNFEPVKIDPRLEYGTEDNLNLKSSAVVPLTERPYSILATSLDHGIPVCAFRLNLPDRILVLQEALKELNLSPGSWIGRLQEALARDLLTENIEVSPGVFFNIEDLSKRVLQKVPGESISYVTDIGFNSTNFSKLVTFLDLTSVFICESNYRIEHVKKAAAYKHLTTKQVALLAASSKAKSTKIFHISKIYGEESSSIAEFDQFMTQYACLDSESLSQVIKKELELLG